MCIHTNGGLTKLFLEEKKTQFLEGMKEYQSTENTTTRVVTDETFHLTLTLVANLQSTFWWLILTLSSY